MLRGGVRAARAGGDNSGDGDDVHDVRGRRRLERGQERAQAPHRAEVVRPDHVLDPLRVAVEEVRARGNPRVVDEQRDARMALAHARSDLLDRRAVGDVADLVLVAELPQPLFAPRERDAMPAVRRQQASRGRADAGGRAGDDRYLHTRTVRLAVAARPAESRIVARTVCLPFFAVFAAQSTEKMSAAWPP